MNIRVEYVREIYTKGEQGRREEGKLIGRELSFNLHRQ